VTQEHEPVGWPAGSKLTHDEAVTEGTAMSMDEMGPQTPGGAMGDMEQQRLTREADKERLVEETEEIHAEEAAERGEAPPDKAPWWRFWRR
jgi:hypothetical protein